MVPVLLQNLPPSSTHQMRGLELGVLTRLVIRGHNNMLWAAVRGDVQSTQIVRKLFQTPEFPETICKSTVRL